MKTRGPLLLAVLCALGAAAFASLPAELAPLIQEGCMDCHDHDSAKGGLDLSTLSFDLQDHATRDRWVRIHDRVEASEMPPKKEEWPAEQSAALLRSLTASLYQADHAEVLAQGRGPLRRLNRDEYEQNLRDLLQLPQLDIRDILPEDRESHHFNKCSETLDLSRVQLTAYLDAAEAALREAQSTKQPPTTIHFRAIGTALFPEKTTFGEREAMFFTKEGHAIETKELPALKGDPALELALFRSANWPYYGYPAGFSVKNAGEYRLRFSARAVAQQPGYLLQPAAHPVPMTFRARRPSGPDVSGDVRATGGILDIQPEPRTYETTIHLRAGETFEYSLLGLPAPLALNIRGGPPTYRYPPFPAGGQPGVAFQWLEVEGPLLPESWPPPSYHVLFGDTPNADAKTLFHRFAHLAAREPVSDEALQKFDLLIEQRRAAGASLPEALLAGYTAFLASSHFLYLREPSEAGDHFAIAERLSHFFTNTRPDPALHALAEQGRLRDAATLRAETERLIACTGFERFVKSFTDYWLNLRYLRRDDPDIRLYPEYRLDDYLVESMGLETRTFFTAMVRENLPAASLVTADLVFANDRLAAHYGLPPLIGSQLRKVALPPQSPLGGLLTEAAILKVTANGTTTSPVVRGAWIMDRLLGQPPPPPPASVPSIEPDIRGAKTIRDILVLHKKGKTCAACHARFDPIGLALENFDILGAWRTQYRGLEQGARITGIDRAGHDFAYTLADPVDASGQLLDGHPFHDIRELKALLAANPRQLARNLLQQFTLYATGTPPRFSDRPEIESMLDACAPAGYRVRDLLLALVQSRVFLGEAGCQ